MIGIGLLFLVLFVFALQKALAPSRFRLDHEWMFIVGAIYYWLLPLILMKVPAPRSGDRFIDDWYYIASQASQTPTLAFGLMASGYVISFIVGGRLSQFVLSRKRDVQPRFSGFSTETISIWPPVVAFSGFTLYALWAYGPLLFTGYTLVFDEFVAIRGPIALGGAYPAGATIFLVVLLTFSAQCYRQNRSPWRSPSYVCGVCAYVIAIGSIASMGARLPALIGIGAFAVCRTLLGPRVSLRHLSLGAILVGVVLSAIGLARFGGGVRLGDLASGVLFETYGTSFSMLYGMIRYTVHSFENPVQFFGEFVNLVPSFLLPDKNALLVNQVNEQFDIYNPYGAINLWVSLGIYFGWAGGMMFMAVLGAVAGVAKKYLNNPLMAGIYCLVSSCFLTTIFRDPLYNSVIKYIFEFSIVGSGLVWIMGVASRSRVRSRQPRTVPQVARGRGPKGMGADCESEGQRP